MTFSHFELFLTLLGLFLTLLGTASLGIATYNIIRMFFQSISERKIAKVSQAHDEQNRLAYRDKQDKRIERLERQMGLWLENQNPYKNKVVP